MRKGAWHRGASAAEPRTPPAPPRHTNHTPGVAVRVDGASDCRKLPLHELHLKKAAKQQLIPLDGLLEKDKSEAV